jgi:hypothetical protein
MENSRRAFMQSSIATALLSGLPPFEAYGSAERPGSSPAHRPLFDVTSKYKSDDVVWLYQRKHLQEGSKFYAQEAAPHINHSSHDIEDLRLDIPGNSTR